MKDTTRCTTIDVAGPIEVLHARYAGHAFSPHGHEEFAIGLIDEKLQGSLSALTIPQPTGLQRIYSRDYVNSKGCS